MTEPTTPSHKRSRRPAGPLDGASPDRAAADPTEALAAAEADAAAEAVAEAGMAPTAGSGSIGVPEGGADGMSIEASTTALETRHDEAIERVSVDSLHLERGGIGDATASKIEVRMGGVGRVRAQDVFVQFGSVGTARADVANVEFGMVGLGVAGELRLTQGIAGNVLAREATVDQGFVRTLIAQHVTVTRPSAALVVLAARVDGQVRTLLDWRGALALGIGFGVAASLARILRRGR